MVWNRQLKTLLLSYLNLLYCVKENCAPIEFEQGTILKVLMVNPHSYLVTVDGEFNFTVALEDENKVWCKL